MLALLAVRWQIRAATERVRQRMKIRHDEREAVARDLHDTLLQGTQSLVLQLDTLHTQVNDAVISKRIDDLATLARRNLIEGRDKVAALRQDHAGDDDPLAHCLRTIEALCRQHGVTLRVTLSGSPRPIRQDASEELVPIVNEAIANALRHSKGTTISLDIRFGWRTFMVSVADDGVGLSDAVIRDGGMDGHWGLRGIRERTALLRGEARFEPTLPRGTTVTVRIPARRLYHPAPFAALRRTRRRLSVSINSA